MNLCYPVLSFLFILFLGCYNAVPIEHDNEKWWEEKGVWITARGHKGRIKVTKVAADSVYGEMDLGHARPAYKQVVVSLDSVEVVKKKELDPLKSVFGVALFSGFAVGVAFLISLSGITFSN